MFFYLLIGVTLLILAGAMWYAYEITRDPLHPLIYLAPLCIYSYAFKPVLLSYMGALDVFFNPAQLLFVQVVNTLGLAGFCLGALYHAQQVTRVRISALSMRAELERMLTPVVRQRVLEIAAVLGAVAVVAFWLLVFAAG